MSFHLQSAICGPHSAVCSLQSAVCGLQSAVCRLRSAVCSLQSAVCGLQSAVCRLQSANVIHRHLGHYTGQTELKVDSLSFLTLINKVQSHSDRFLRGLGGLGVFVFKIPRLHCINKLLFLSIEMLLYLNISLLSPLFTPCFVAHNKELQLFLIFNRSMSSSEAKTLRVCANSFLDHLSLVVETIEAFGPPMEES